MENKIYIQTEKCKHGAFMGACATCLALTDYKFAKKMKHFDHKRKPLHSKAVEAKQTNR